MSDHSAHATTADRIADFAHRVQTIRNRLHQVVVGQDDTIDKLLMCALTGSHALLVGVPGLAKTLMVKALAAAFHWKFARIQFTPDLMPSDITGYELLGRERRWPGAVDGLSPGPVFANLVLADEINRAAPKTQSALLEAMAERHVTVGGQTYPLEEPFLVVATQNPIEQEGTYPLPEAQLDRFMMEIHVDYPTPPQEEEIVLKTTRGATTLPRAGVRSRDVLAAARPGAGGAGAGERGRIRRPAVRSQPPGRYTGGQFIKDYVAWGAGPRGSQNLVLAAKARALLIGRPAPTVEDVRAVALPILRHRIIVNHRAVGDGITSTKVAEHLLSQVAARVSRRGHAAQAQHGQPDRPRMRTRHTKPISRPPGARGARAHAVHDPPSHRRRVQRPPRLAATGRGRRIRRFPRVFGRRRPPPARLESSRPHREGIYSPAPGRNQSGLHAGDRRQRLDAVRRQATRSAGSKLEYAQYLATALATSSSAARTRSAWPCCKASWKSFSPPAGTSRTSPGSTR